MKKFRWNLHTIIRGVGLIQRLSSGFLYCCIMQSVLKALSPFVNIYMSAVVINGLIAGQKMERLLLYVLVLVALNLICGGLDALIGKQVNVRQNILLIRYRWELNKKLMDLPYADVEDYATQELREKINQMEMVNGMGLWNLVNAIKSTVQNSFTVIFAFSFFCSLFLQNRAVGSGILLDFFCSPWASLLLAALIFGNVLVNLYTVSQSTSKVFQAFAGLVPLNRIYTFYLENYIDTYHSGKDIRLYKQGGLIREEMLGIIKSGQTPMKKLKGIEFKYTSLASFSTITVNLFIYLTIGIRALAGAISIGSIVQYIGGISQFITGFTTLISQLTLLNANVEALDVILQYLDKKSSMMQGKRKIDSSSSVEIRFQNVSFTYPGTEVPVLKDLSFTIHSGEKLAIVGMNGSGKTTMIKLLCRLYEVVEGEILINGINIKEFEVEAYQDLYGVVFQDFQLFSFGLGENLAGNQMYDAEKARKVLHRAGFGQRLERMNMKTPLYKDFDPKGVEISGGEAQKIAIARALYKEAPILVMDEPTAALDPQSEYEIYKNINDISEDKTVIFISHRMSSCRFCSRVMVFDKGEIVQMGSHAELLKNKNGKYYELWHSQEQHYK